MELTLKAYYNLIDDCVEYPEWTRKVEEEIGSNIAFMVTAFDESVRDELVDRSELFKKFVRIIICLLKILIILKNIGYGEAKVLQVSF